MEKARLFFIDNLRVLMITLVIIQHLSVTYGGVGGWYYYDGEPDQISGIVLRKVQMFHLLKFAFTVVIAVPLSFALGNVIRKLPLARRIL